MARFDLVPRALRGRALIALLCVLALACAPTAPSALTQAEFRDEVRKSIAAAHPTLTLEVRGDLEILGTDASGKKFNLFLDNAYREYLQAPDRLQELATRHAESLLESQDLQEVDRARIVPVVKDRAWIAETIAAVKERGGEGPAEYVSEVLNDQLTIVYAEDLPRSIRYLTPESLVKLGLAPADLRPLALANLRRILPQIELHRSPTVTMIMAGGSYEASLLLLDEVWSGEIVPVEGEPVVTIPARDLLLVTGTKTPGGIARLREVAGKSKIEAAYRLTDTLFVYRQGHFTEFVEP